MMYCVLARIMCCIVVPYFQRSQCLWVIWVEVLSKRCDFVQHSKPGWLQWSISLLFLHTGSTSTAGRDESQFWTPLPCMRGGSTWVCAGLCRLGRRCVCRPVMPTPVTSATCSLPSHSQGKRFGFQCKICFPNTCSNFVQKTSSQVDASILWMGYGLQVTWQVSLKNTSLWCSAKYSGFLSWERVSFLPNSVLLYYHGLCKQKINNSLQNHGVMGRKWLLVLEKILILACKYYVQNDDDL